MEFIANIYNRIKDEGISLKNNKRIKLGQFLGLLIKEFHTLKDNGMQNKDETIQLWVDFLKIVAKNTNKFWMLNSKNSEIL